MRDHDEMGGGRYNDQVGFTYKETMVCVIPPGGAHPINLAGQASDPTFARQMVDIQALNGRGQWTNVPILSNPGVSRNYRDGQIVLVAFRNANYQQPIVLGHFENTEGDPRFADPLIIPQDDQSTNPLIDDQWYIHPETGAFLRFRNLGGTRTFAPQPLGPAQPAEVLVRLSSGTELKFTESGDAPDTVCDVLLSVNTGAGTVTLTIDGTTGAVEVTSPKVTLTSPDVELGSDSSADDNYAVVRKSDIENFIRGIYNEHTHPSNGAPPSQQMAEPPYAQKTFAE